MQKSVFNIGFTTFFCLAFGHNHVKQMYVMPYSWGQKRLLPVTVGLYFGDKRFIYASLFTMKGSKQI